MARNKQPVIPVETILPKYYVYYDNRTKRIFSASNELDDTSEFVLEIPEDLYIKLVDGEAKFDDYAIDYVGPPENAILDIVLKKDRGVSFKNNMFVSIFDYPVDDTDLVVIWDNPNKQWKFKASQTCKEYIKKIDTGLNLLFFVTVESDFDLLVRIISLELSDIASHNEICIPFEHKIESDITRISISTKAYFKSYGLIVNE